jgi:hypothetical protein
VALIPGAPAQAATQVPVLTSSNGEFQPARSDTGLAWEQNTRAQPKHYDAIYRSDGGPTIQVNRPGSGAAMGDIAGGKVIYQQYKGTLYTRRGRSDIYSYDIATGARSKVPGVNSKRWEYWPSVSGPWVLFARHKVVKNKEIRWLFLRNLDTGEQLRLDRVKAKIKRRFFIGPGQVNGNYVVWSACKPRCEVYRFDLITRTTQVITNPGAYQRAPSVTPGGTVYFSRGGKGCGDSVSLVRAAPDGSQEVMVQLQTGLDIFDTYSHMAPSGVTEVYYERDVCGQPAGGDIYKILDPELAGLTVNLVGSGSGTVTSSPVGINCEPDCAHDYPGGASVTLQAQPDPDSYFAGWTGACTGTGACTVTMDGAKSVTAMFELAGTITIVKDALPDAPDDFPFTVSGLTPSNFTLDDDNDGTLSNTRTFTGLRAGTYTVTESPPPSGWQRAGIACAEDGIQNTTPGVTLASIQVEPGEEVTCTFTNARDGTISVRKDALPDDGQDFRFDPSWQTTDFFLDDDGNDDPLTNSETFTGLTTGQIYTVLEENIPANWQLTDIDCVGGGANTSDAGATATIGLDAGEAVVCTFTNTQESTIAIVKDAVNNSPQDFSFTATGLTPSAFNLDDDADGTLSNEREFGDLLPQTYTVTEGADPAGWQLTDITCAGGGPNTTDTGRTATIGLDPGENVTCTFTNTQEGTITVVKDAVNDAPQDFTFSTTGGLTPPTFALDDDADGTLSNTQIFGDLLPGEFTVSEAADPAGWQLTDITCLGGGPDTTDTARTATIGLDPGENVTCTFTNTEEGSITVVKDAQPNDPQDFSFTSTGGLTPSAFDLDDDADGTLSNTRAFIDLLPGTFTVTEGADPPGWSLTNLQCTGGGADTTTAGHTATIGLDPGEDVTCTFTNSGEGTITIVKDAVNNSAQDFTFTAGGGLSPSTFSLDDDADNTLSNQRVFSGVAAGLYSVTEGADPTGWQLTNLQCIGGGLDTTTAGRTATIGLDPGENVTCTFTNTEEGSITIVKDAQPDSAQDFQFDPGPNLDTGPNFFLDDDADPTLSNERVYPDLLPGSYAISEVSVPAGWSLTNTTCSDGSNPGAINLSVGEDVTCTFTNTQAGAISITKQTNPDGSTQSFEFDPSYGTMNFTLTDGQTNNSGPLSPGTYSVAEVNTPVGWTLTNTTCSDGSPASAIVLGPGETVSCTFTNTQDGQIHITKQTNPDGSAQIFEFNPSYSTTNFSLTDGETNNSGNLDPGTYSVDEVNLPAGWNLTATACSDGSPVNAIVLGAGETVTCTFTNSQEASITIVKDATPNAAQDFSYTTTGGLTPATFSLDDDANGTLSNEQVFDDVTPATYTVSEEADPAGWELTNLACAGGGPDTTTADRTATIGLDFGEDVECTFTNTQEGSITIVKDAQPDGAQDFEFDPSANLDPGTNFLLDDDADGTLSAQRTFTGLLPGTYAVDEVNMPGGWNLTSTSCTDSSTPGVINLGPGENVTCTFTNTMGSNPPIITESFNKSDGAGLGPDLSWTDFHGAGWSTTGGQAYVPQGPEAPFIARANQDLGSADHYAEAPLAVNPNGDGQAGVAVRCSSSAITCYFGLVSGNGTTPNMIGKMVEGVVTILTSENDPTGAGGVVRLEIVGSQLTLRVNGAVELAATDTEITTGTRTGVAGATEPGAARWSSFAAGTL